MVPCLQAKNQGGFFYRKEGLTTGFFSYFKKWHRPPRLTEEVISKKVVPIGRWELFWEVGTLPERWSGVGPAQPQCVAPIPS